MQAQWIETHVDNQAPLNTNRSTSKYKKASENNSDGSHTVKRMRVSERASGMNSDQARDLVLSVGIQTQWRRGGMSRKDWS